jgi:hypothetical protein
LRSPSAIESFRQHVFDPIEREGRRLVKVVLSPTENGFLTSALNQSKEPGWQQCYKYDRLVTGFQGILWGTQIYTRRSAPIGRAVIITEREDLEIHVTWEPPSWDAFRTLPLGQLFRDGANDWRESWSRISRRVSAA